MILLFRHLLGGFQLIEQFFKGRGLSLGDILCLIGRQEYPIVEVRDAIALLVHFAEIVMQGERSHHVSVKIQQRGGVHNQVFFLPGKIAPGDRVVGDRLPFGQNPGEKRRARGVVIEKLSCAHADIVFRISLPAPADEHFAVHIGQALLQIAGGEGDGHAAHDALGDSEFFLDHAGHDIKGGGQLTDFILLVYVHGHEIAVRNAAGG